MSATRLRDYLDAYGAHPERLQGDPSIEKPAPERSAALARYAGIGCENREGSHELH